MAGAAPKRRPLSRRQAVTLLQIMLFLAVLALGAWLVFRATPPDLMREGDALFAQKHYYAALGRYHAAEVAHGGPRELLRVGMVEVVRGEVAQAGKTLALALRDGLPPHERDLARLYQGHAATQAGQLEQAHGFWRTIEADSAFYPYRRVLEGEALLAAANYAAAEKAYRAAINAGLPADWQRTALARIAALRASSDIEGARATLIEIAAVRERAAELFTVPLLPAALPTPEALAQALDAPDDERALRLGQVYLDAELVPLAANQFRAAPGRVAQVYAAYAQLRGGDRAGGQAGLEALVAAAPEDARARALLALAYLDEIDPRRARAQLETVRALAPNAPDTHLAWGQWHAAQSDYVAAADEYRRAVEAAPAEQRGRYLLALARFQLDTTVRLCDDGRAAADDAATLLDSADAWTTAAAARLACGDAEAARAAAERARQLAPASAEAAFYHGQALALLGQPEQARAALIAAADNAPASEWRKKAEESLAALRGVAR